MFCVPCCVLCVLFACCIPCSVLRAPCSVLYAPHSIFFILFLPWVRRRIAPSERETKKKRMPRWAGREQLRWMRTEARRRTGGTRARAWLRRWRRPIEGRLGEAAGARAEKTRRRGGAEGGIYVAMAGAPRSAAPCPRASDTAWHQGHRGPRAIGGETVGWRAVNGISWVQ